MQLLKSTRIGIRLSPGYLTGHIANPVILIMIGIITINAAQNHRSREAPIAKLALQALAARHWHEPAFAKSETSWRISNTTRNRKPSTLRSPRPTCVWQPRDHERQRGDATVHFPDSFLSGRPAASNPRCTPTSLKLAPRVGLEPTT